MLWIIRQAWQSNDILPQNNAIKFWTNPITTGLTLQNAPSKHSRRTSSAHSLQQTVSSPYNYGIASLLKSNALLTCCIQPALIHASPHTRRCMAHKTGTHSHSHHLVARQWSTNPQNHTVHGVVAGPTHGALAPRLTITAATMSSSPRHERITSRARPSSSHNIAKFHSWCGTSIYKRSLTN